LTVTIRVPLFVCIVAIGAITACTSFGDVVVVRVEVKESTAKGNAAAADPSIALPPADAKTVLSVETLAAGANGQFATKTTVGNETIELKGDLKKAQDGQYRVRVEFKNSRPGGAQEVSTNIMLPASTPRSISGLESRVGQRYVVLTLEEAAPAAK
jgi:hypothetical protein